MLGICFFTQREESLKGRSEEGEKGVPRWESPLTDYNGSEHIHAPQLTVDEEATAKLVALAEATLGDLITVQLKTLWWWTLGMT